MKRIVKILIYIFSLPHFLMAQNGFVLENERSDKIKFQLINNLIVIPVEINGVALSFLLDTGVSKSIIFNLVNFEQPLNIKESGRVQLKGLGSGKPVEAVRSTNNIIKIGDAINLNQDIFAVYDPELNFAPKLGVPIHGIIGYHFFKNFIVEINYARKYIKLNDPDTFKYKKCNKCQKLKLNFYNNKPYIPALITLKNNKIPVSLLIDSGGSDALWLFQDENKGIVLPDKNFEDFLGKGLSGSVYGKRSKLASFSIGKFKLRAVNVAFPDTTTVKGALQNKLRDGSVSGDILNRFNIIFDYPNKTVQFKKNNNFSNPFRYDKSGITLEYQGVRLVRETINQVEKNDANNLESSDEGRIVISYKKKYRYIFAPSFAIVDLRSESPAKNSGLMLNDIVLSVNGKSAHHFTLQEILGEFNGDEGKTIRLVIDRNGVQLKFKFNLKSML